jgi:hypothetical protein
MSNILRRSTRRRRLKFESMISAAVLFVPSQTFAADTWTAVDVSGVGDAQKTVAVTALENAGGYSSPVLIDWRVADGESDEIEVRSSIEITAALTVVLGV